MANRTKIHPLVARGIQQLVRGEATNVDGTPMTRQQFADALNVHAATVSAAVNGTGGYRYQSPSVLADGHYFGNGVAEPPTEKEPTGETLPDGPLDVESVFTCDKTLVLDALQDLAGAVRDLEHALAKDRGIDVRTAAYVHALGRRAA